MIDNLNFGKQNITFQLEEMNDLPTLKLFFSFLFDIGIAHITSLNSRQKTSPQRDKLVSAITN